MSKRKWMASLGMVTLVMASVVSGCGTKTESNPATAPAATQNAQEPVKLKFAMWEAQGDLDFWTEKVKEYSKLKPNVNVEVLKVPDNKGQYLKVNLAANDLPDVFYMKPAALQVYKQALQPLDDLPVTKDNKYVTKIDGKTLGLPLVSFYEVVYYHPSIFKELGLEIPKTMPEFIALCEKIKADGKYVPLSLGMKDSWTSYPFMEFGPHVLSGDESFLTNLPKNEAPFAANSSFDKAAKFLQEISNEKLAGPDPLSISFDQQTQAFEAKKAAMTALGQWYYPGYLDKVKSEDDLGAFVMPWRSSESEPLTAMTMSDMHVGISKNSKNLEESKAFLQWVFSQPVYGAYLNTSKQMSTMSNVKSDNAFFDKQAEKAPFKPFVYNASDEMYNKVKAAAQYDPSMVAQDIFAGKSIDKLEADLNNKWKKAIDSSK
ncbi:ABC transporter substrate-binding protein [Paenibacillus sp. GCM10023248]|uniref:ABC transporter substrate-binding protein n=1 Tax=Bacillales TaxID=1385 RepID=UPI00237885DF|nr:MULTISPECIES: extracellular solute-binding protein [Bacillales]MDD9265485.1 extracellular solute-binding protein [Paenibacillus sp. MAHUQ-63]MDR6882479.1 raffinose/stachyose/melibiose transport system substrate-binding protein [Bacillus sp. 3255]